jgi:2-iminobutanoate/2-iminopropanoate deaminase
MHLARITIAAALVALAVPCTAAGQRGQMPAPEFISAGPNLPFSQAVRVGRTIYLSGMLGMTAEGQLAPGGIEGETQQTLENIKAALQPLGATMDDVVKCTVFLADMAEWPAMNEVYVTFFPTNKPARSAVAVSGLARNARVEIECIAVRR